MPAYGQKLMFAPERLLIGLVFALLATPVISGPFDQLHQLEIEHQRAQSAEAAKAKAQEEANRQRAVEKAAAQRRATAQENARRQTRTEHRKDQDRALDLEERRLKLQVMKAKADRANEYVDAELRDNAAKTDVVQSHADALRTVSTGAKALLEDTGKADVNRSNRLFGN